MEAKANFPAESVGPHNLLLEDHRDVDQLLRALMTALDDGDAVASLAHLDLFWARLAMHIRAEHLHLFPMVLQALNRDGSPHPEAQKNIEQLRLDHDFFMHELASAIQTMRVLSHLDRNVAETELKQVRDTILEVKKRLTIHNQSEEQGIYVWAKTYLNEDEQAALARLIHAELTHLPPRFAATK